ncbi:hypothetical protein [Nannocystis pusilla]|uniref:hypothetical protein n=1 Tax=Nannocystis pusilla TaxID=889268 RepID=UPI003B7BCA12
MCLVDGVERGDSCPAEMICQQDFEMLSDKASRCCGFDLEPDLEEPPRALGPSL